VICPYCEHNDDKVIDSRSSEGGRVIRRRRECLHCEKRFTTYERVDQAARLTVVKRDGKRQQFDLGKVLAGIEAACGKRPIPEAKKHAIAESVEDELGRRFDREVPSKVIGELVMNKLRSLDPVVLIRYASEYYPGWSVEDIERQIEELTTLPPELENQQELF